MANLEFKGRSIYYDVQGSGKPILLLNGIMMSTKSWEPFVKSLSHDNQLIRVDFMDQGQSDKLKNSEYTQSMQVDILHYLLKELNISKVNVVGISYGGEVALQFAIKHASLVDRLVLFNTTAYTSPWLAEIGYSWNAIGKTRNGQNYYQAAIPVIYSPSFYEQKLDWMKKREQTLIPVFSNAEFLEAMERLTNSAESYDVRDKLDLIKMPTLIIAADEDYLTPMANQKYLNEHIKDSQLVIIPGAGHASMYEKPLLFVTLILGFVNALETEFKI
jgi:pimeloyl-ACP methyl ester carboxylesterase